MLKKLLDEAKNLSFQKDLKIKKLKAQLHPGNYVNMFEEFGKYFNSAQIEHLRSIQRGERKDSTFVTNCMHYLYGGHIDLSNRVVTPLRVPNGKSVISPDKFDVVGKMFEERLRAEAISEDKQSLRSNRLNKLLNNAISTANKRRKHSEKELTQSSPSTASIGNIIIN